MVPHRPEFLSKLKASIQALGVWGQELSELLKYVHAYSSWRLYGGR